MEWVMGFLENHWYVGLIVVLLAIFSLRILLKALLVGAVLAAVLFFGFGYSPGEVWNYGLKLVGMEDTLYTKIQPLIEKELENAEIITEADGAFRIKTENAEIRGNRNEDVVTVVYQENEFEISVSQLSGLLRRQIEALVPVQ